MTRVVTLNALKAGISRLRTKGGADPSSLYDLVNGYVTQAGTVTSRPGTVNKAILPVATKGLCAFKGQLFVFSDSPKVVPVGYACEVLIHPSDRTLTLTYIHYARPFLGFLYVVGEWSNGDIYHYWLQDAQAWQANHVYMLNAVVRPTSPNGFGYVAERLAAPGSVWTSGVTRATGDRVEPTVPNGFEYVVIEVYGGKPASGNVEPVWPTAGGGTVSEDTDGLPVTLPTIGDGGAAEPPPDVIDRYGNPGGSKPGTNQQAP
ncbi:MAG: hypothetical protein ACREO8_06590 [Luteimonas sp.]